jgi:hypothetical protein
MQSSHTSLWQQQQQQQRNTTAAGAAAIIVSPLSAAALHRAAELTAAELAEEAQLRAAFPAVYAIDWSSDDLTTATAGTAATADVTAAAAASDSSAGGDSADADVEHMQSTNVVVHASRGTADARISSATAAEARGSGAASRRRADDSALLQQQQSDDAAKSSSRSSRTLSAAQVQLLQEENRELSEQLHSELDGARQVSTCTVSLFSVVQSSTLQHQRVAATAALLEYDCVTAEHNSISRYIAWHCSVMLCFCSVHTLASVHTHHAKRLCLLSA